MGAYATASDVAELNRARVFTASSRPTASEVGRYLDLTAAELDGIIREHGYALPVATTATSALMLLAHGNALGAAWMVEQGAEVSDRLDMAYKAWQDFKKSVAAGVLALDDPADLTSGVPRSGSSASAVFAWPTDSSVDQ